MLRRDYIQRMIEEFARVVARALGMKDSGQSEGAVNELRDAYRTWFALDVETIAGLSPEELTAKLAADPDFQMEKIEALAYGIKAEAELLSPVDPAAADRREKALALFRYLEDTDKANFSFTRKAAIAGLEQMGR